MKLTKKEFLTQLEKLVAFRTLTGDLEQNALALDFVVSLLSPKVRVKRIKNGNAEILIAGTNNSLTPDVGYLVHIDVVAASDGMFRMKKKGNVIRGRGVSDMKFSIPIGVALLNELAEKPIGVSMSLAITTDEEIGGFEGGAFLAQKMGWKPKAMIVPDGGDNLKFVKASKGVAQFKVTALGKSAHASRPWDGENAVPKIARLVMELEKRYGKNNLKKSWTTTLNFGQIAGGISTNQVCDRTELKIDFRYPETDSFERIQKELAGLTKAIDPSITIEPMSTGLPTFTDTALPVVQKFLGALKKQFKQDIAIEPNFGASDARHFASFDVPVLMIKPMGGDIHMESEWLDVDSAMTFYEALRGFVGLQKLLR